VADDLVDVVGESGQLVGGDLFGCGVEPELEFVAAPPQLGEFAGDLLDPGLQQPFVDLAVFVVGEVPVDDDLLLGELGGDGSQFGLGGGERGAMAVLCLGD
jgi:hypothetical protein